MECQPSTCILSLLVTLGLICLGQTLGQKELVDSDVQALSNAPHVTKRQWAGSGNVAWGKRWGGNIPWGKRWRNSNIAWGKRNYYDTDELDDDMVDKRGDWKYIKLRAWGKRSINAAKVAAANQQEPASSDKRAWSGSPISWGKRSDSDNGKIPFVYDAEDAKRAWQGSPIAWGKRGNDDKRAWSGNIAWGKRSDDKRAWGGNIAWGKRGDDKRAWSGNAIAWGKRLPADSKDKKAWGGGNISWGKRAGFLDQADDDKKRAWSSHAISWGKREDSSPETNDESN